MLDDRVSKSDSPSTILQGISIEASSSPVETDREVICKVWDASDVEVPTT
jgi:hypothetical protein